MRITSKQHTYQRGPHKGVTVSSKWCVADGAPLIVVSEILGSQQLGVSYASTGICDVPTMDAGLAVAKAITDEKTHDIEQMRRIASKLGYA